ncbi:class I SAM-dependent methyltransferase [Isoptericola sp. F-RaC21]|uniref:class I SAM-dependent methyltransferase n=1 Tax=Isoptericola sp. F-RaC21 TaxID=3141452 RepID=UPI00315BB48E
MTTQPATITRYPFTTGAVATDYLFDTASDAGQVQVDCLSRMLDGTTRGILDDVGVSEGWRCLELGAGNGSVARWLSGRAGPTGTVDAVDIDVTHLDPGPGVTVHRHDVDDGLPVDGPFDVIHARLLLMHVARRAEILRRLVDALAPGGWLVVTDISDRVPFTSLSADPDDGAVFDHVLEVGTTRVTRAAGIDIGWAREVGRHMRDAGLEDVHGLEDVFTARGGSPALQYYGSLVSQIEGPLRAEGVTDAELRRFGDLMSDPGFSAWSYEFVSTWGRRPAARH